MAYSPGEAIVNEQFNADPVEATQSAISMGISAMNGVFALAGAMAGRGMLSKSDVGFLHDNMLKPLTNDGCHQGMMAMQMKQLDDLCATLLMAMDQINNRKD